MKFYCYCISLQNSYFTIVNVARYQHIPDQEILEHYYADHNNDWLGILLQRYTLLLFGVCMKYLKNEEEAKDGVQQIFLKVISELPRYKVTYFKSWIYMVAKNHCLMKLRNRQGKMPAALSDQLIATVPETMHDNEWKQKEITFETMTASLKELSSEQQQCVTLFYLEKKSYAEVSERTGFTPLQVKSYIQNGKRNLKNIMEKKLGRGQENK